MSAEREEVVVDPDALDAEHLLPDRDERSLERRARLDVRGILAIAVCARRGKALLVELSVRRARERIEEDETRRHHPLGQLERRSLTEEILRRTRSIGGDIGDEPRRPARVLENRGRDLPHPLDAGEHALDLAQLDAETAKLHLRVASPQADETAVGSIGADVARAVHASALASREGIGPKRLRRELGGVAVAARDAFAADPDLAGD